MFSLFGFVLTDGFFFLQSQVLVVMSQQLCAQYFCIFLEPFVIYCSIIENIMQP